MVPSSACWSRRDSWWSRSSPTQESSVGRWRGAARGARRREVEEIVGRHVEHVRQGRQHGGVLRAAPVSSSETAV